MGLLSFLFGCKKEVITTDKEGNTIIKKGEKTSIIPAQYIQKRVSYKMFLRNESKNTVSIVDRFTLKPNEEKTFEFTDVDSIFLDNGIKIYFGETGLEVEDKKGELAGIGGEYWEKYNVPDDVEYGFIIVPPYEGDSPTK